MKLSDTSVNTNTNKERLQKINETVLSENVSTDELLNMLEEAVNIGMDVCKKAQNNIAEKMNEETTTNDGEE